MTEFSFSSWLSNFGEPFWEGLRDISALPMDKIKLEPIQSDDDDSSDFEAEEFDRDSAWDDCSDAGDDIDVSDYSDNPIYDDPEDDEDFDTQTVDDWIEENPEPDREEFKTDEEYAAALEKWQEARDQVDEEYDDAVSDWKKEMEKRRESAWENAQDARDEAISDCVSEKESEHESDQERNRERHEEEQEERNRTSPNGNSGYNSNFTVGNDNFLVAMDREKIEYQNKPLVGVFGVTFRGPAGYSLTNKNNGGEAMQKYNHLLASVAKMVETEEATGRPVNGFTFYPAEPAMGLMYQKFYTDYLKPAGFLRVKSDLYLKKDYIRELTSDMMQYQKKAAYSTIKQTGREVRSALDKVRAEKGVMRNVKTTLPKLVGNVVLFKTPYSYTSPPIAGLVVGTTETGYEPNVTIVGNDGGQLATNTISYRNIFNIAPDPADPKGIMMKLSMLGEPSHEQVVPLLQQVAQSPNLMKSLPNIQQLFAKFGIVAHAPQIHTPQLQTPELAPA